MHRVFIGLGGNLGNPIKTIREAACLIASLSTTKEFQLSHFYETSPVGDPNQPDYINAVAVFFTSLEWHEVWDQLTEIETQLGKKAKGKNEPRIVDIDLLFYDDLQMSFEGFYIPHPSWMERLFVLMPLNEFIDEIKVADSTWSILSLIENLKDGDQVCKKIRTKMGAGPASLA
jgi:2-amino-4-hydroxy-6-hydroxymethyldihydropteridine diphosphokinase